LQAEEGEAQPTAASVGGSVTWTSLDNIGVGGPARIHRTADAGLVPAEAK
jgi:hypothetical protein